jgi:hypothetical protein
MTQSDMIRLAREAGWKYADGDDGYSPLWKFGELVAAAEREACADMCVIASVKYREAKELLGTDELVARGVTAGGILMADKLAADIRARGQE